MLPQIFFFPCSYYFFFPFFLSAEGGGIRHLRYNSSRALTTPPTSVCLLLFLSLFFLFSVRLLLLRIFFLSGAALSVCLLRHCYLRHSRPHLLNHPLITILFSVNVFVFSAPLQPLSKAICVRLLLSLFFKSLAECLLATVKVPPPPSTSPSI